jgi:signal transduction histidine kinase
MTLLLGVVGISTWTAVASASRARTQLETQVRHVARTLSQVSVPLPEVLEHVKGVSGAEYVLLGTDGSRLATFPEKDLKLPPLEPVTGENDWQDLRLGPSVQVGEKTYLSCRVRLPHPQSRGGVLYQDLYILYPEERWRDALWEAIRPSLVLGSFVGLASVALAVGVGQRLSRRVRELERRTSLIAAGDFSPMPLPGRNDELRDLGRSVNEMAARLAQLQETVQKTERLRLLGQLGGGLIHQLRNGLAGARLAVQLHARACAGRTDGEALEVALRQLNLLEANLKRFLALGQTGNGRREPCSLTGLVTEAVELLRPQCRHAAIEFRCQLPAGEYLLIGDPVQLQQVFLNVLGNAMEAAGPGGWVAVSARAVDARKVVIEIADSGPGPPPEIADRLFEVFVTSKPEGVGLGLAVARQVTEAHGGTITWERRASATCFCISLPVSSAAEALNGASGRNVVSESSA